MSTVFSTAIGVYERKLRQALRKIPERLEEDLQQQQQQQQQQQEEEEEEEEEALNGEVSIRVVWLVPKQSKRRSL